MIGKQHKKMIQVLWALLIPIARLVISAGVTYREFSEIAKRAFVEVAVRDFGKRGRLTNISRVAVMTGLTRKEISAIRDSKESALDYQDEVLTSPIGKNLPSEILRRWYTDSRYLGSDGRPIPLDYNDSEPTFSSLVRLCDKDIPLGAVREEMIRVGAVMEMKDGKLMPCRQEFIPAGQIERIIEGVAYGLRMQAETIAYNANASNISNLRFQRVASSDSVPVEKANALEKELTAHLAKSLRDIDDIISRTAEPTEAHLPPTEEFAVGFYIYRNTES
ncbi:MAG: hypothetical protein D6698_16485 [Gammaproteobacteria bacterium]|nr:MAG: hypothetical protein D6698_16485 [Gammaproteobacteria bacterium]